MRKSGDWRRSKKSRKGFEFKGKKVYLIITTESEDIPAED